MTEENTDKSLKILVNLRVSWHSADSCIERCYSAPPPKSLLLQESLQLSSKPNLKEGPGK